MLELAARFYAYLNERGIDPNKVKIVLRADDDQTLDHLKFEVSHDLGAMMQAPVLVSEIKNLKINGLAFSFSSLDHSK